MAIAIESIYYDAKKALGVPFSQKKQAHLAQISSFIRFSIFRLNKLFAWNNVWIKINWNSCFQLFAACVQHPKHISLSRKFVDQSSNKELGYFLDTPKGLVGGEKGAEKI